MIQDKNTASLDVPMDNLQARGLSVRYITSDGPIYAVDDVDFEMGTTKSLGIAGESACGKSTLGLAVMRMLFNAESHGDISIDGRSISDMPESEFDAKYRWKRIAMVFQGAMNSLDPVFTIRAQFIEILKQHDFREDVDDTITDAIKSVNLDAGVLKKYPHELSGGMKQRVVLAMALLLRPDFVIADEPTTALDVLTQAHIINLFKDCKKAGMSFMLITHDLAVLSEIADVIGIMYGGHMVEFGSSREIYENPKHPYTKGLLKSIPVLRGEKPAYIRGTPPSLHEPATGCRFIDRCPEAIEKCKQVPPKFRTDSGYVRCWLYDDVK